jgi:very-short-patch-repair endonuclease
MANEFARKLRRTPTDAERKLWTILRQRQFSGCKFRRQVPLGPYVADFVCFERRLIIEVDGGQHGWQAEQDDRRSDWLRAQGFHIVRFWNHEILRNIEGVAVVIGRALTP